MLFTFNLARPRISSSRVITAKVLLSQRYISTSTSTYNVFPFRVRITSFRKSRSRLENSFSNPWSQMESPVPARSMSSSATPLTPPATGAPAVSGPLTGFSPFDSPGRGEGLFASLGFLAFYSHLVHPVGECTFPGVHKFPIYYVMYLFPYTVPAYFNYKLGNDTRGFAQIWNLHSALMGSSWCDKINLNSRTKWERRWIPTKHSSPSDLPSGRRHT